MTLSNLPIEITESERTPLVNWLLQVIEQQQQVIEQQHSWLLTPEILS